MLRPGPSSPGTLLRDLWKDGAVLMPGVYDGISAVSALGAGASALYLTGAGLTNARLGVPDVALATLTEFAQAAAAVCAVTGLPVLSDADTGFGGAWNAYRTVQEMERAGLAGIHLEDQMHPKRCGHLDGKSLVPRRGDGGEGAGGGGGEAGPDVRGLRADGRAGRRGV